jgi:hypothetical protein
MTLSSAAEDILLTFEAMSVRLGLTPLLLLAAAPIQKQVVCRGLSSKQLTEGSALGKINNWIKKAPANNSNVRDFGV